MKQASAPRRIELVALGLLIALYVSLSLGYAVNTPKWNNPDEPAHYNYIRDIALDARFPVMQSGDFNADLLEQLKAARFPPAMSVDSVRYEGHQPPLYYILAAGIYKLAPTGSDQAALNLRVLLLRLFSVLCGCGLLVAAYLLAWTLFPGAATAGLRLGVPAFIALLPMHIAMSAAINNDALAELVLAVLLLVLCWLLAGWLRPAYAELLAGLLWGLALLTKTTIYLPAALAVAIALFWFQRFNLVRTVLAGLRVALLGLLVSGWWFIRNLVVYGWPDFFGLIRHDAVAGAQPAGRLVEDWSNWSQTTFQSFWGQFGWMGVVAEGRYYSIVRWLTIIALIGLALGLIQLWRNPRLLSRFQYACLSVFAGVLVTVAAALLYYNLRFYQAQGRYLYPALIPLAFAFAGGYRIWFGLVADGAALVLRARWLPAAGLQLAAMAMLYLCFVGLNLWLLNSLIIPYFSR